MIDPFDIASEREQEARDDAIAAQRRRAGLTGKTVADSALFCQDDECGAPIPQRRREAVPGCQFCIDCQELHEMRRR